MLGDKFVNHLENCLRFGVLSTTSKRINPENNKEETVFLYTIRGTFTSLFPINVYQYVGQKQLKAGLKKISKYINNHKLINPKNH